MAAALRQRHGAEKVRIVVNRYDHAAEIAADDLEHAVGGRVGFKFPSNYRLAIDALNKGRPLVVDNHNKLAASFRELARDLAGVPERESGPEPGGLFGLLKGRR